MLLKKSTRGSKSTSTVNSTDKLWIASRTEISGCTDDGYRSEGIQYEYWSKLSPAISDSAKNPALYRKTRAGNCPKRQSGSTSKVFQWWTRSPVIKSATSNSVVDSWSSTSFDAVFWSGLSFISSYALLGEGVVLCFCF